MTIEQIILIITLAVAGGGGLGTFVRTVRQTGKNSDEIADMRLTVVALGEANDKLRIEIIALRKDYDVLQKDNVDKTAIIDELKTKLAQSEDRQRVSDQTIARMQGQLDEQRKNYENMIDRQARRLEELIVSSVEEKRRAESFAEQLNKERQITFAQKGQIDAVESELAKTKEQLQKTQSELDMTKEQLAHSTNELREEKTKRITLEAKIATLEVEVNHLKEKIETLIITPMPIPAANPPPIAPEGAKE